MFSDIVLTFFKYNFICQFLKVIESKVCYLHDIMPLLNSGENVQFCTVICDPRDFIWVTGSLAHWCSMYLQDGRYVEVSTYRFKLMCFA